MARLVEGTLERTSISSNQTDRQTERQEEGDGKIRERVYATTVP
jgi:hypothetical protein